MMPVAQWDKLRLLAGVAPAELHKAADCMAQLLAEVEQLRGELEEERRERNDAIRVLDSMGIIRHVCGACGRRTASRGYRCWTCGDDNDPKSDEL
jgi:tRNA(Ile2) C34 agmatinyltransferase TiaS